MFRKTLRCLILLLLLAGVAGGAAIWYAWVRGDEYARQELLRRLSGIAPACDFQVGRARFDWNRSIHVRDFAIHARGPNESPALVVPEAVLQIDRERFLNEQVVDVQVIRLVEPTLEIARRIDGTWSLEDLLPFRLDERISVPEWQIEDATICFRLEQSGESPLLLTLKDADLRLVPSGRKQLLVRGLTDVADAGPLQVSGQLDLEHGTWFLTGSMKGLDTAGDLAGFALSSSEDLQAGVAALRTKLGASIGRESRPEAIPVATAERQIDARTGDAAPVLPANAALPRTTPGEAAVLAELGLRAVLDVSFEVSKQEREAAPAFKVEVECTDGELDNPLLPLPLRHLRGSLYCDNSKLQLTALSADSGSTRLAASGAFDMSRSEPTGSAHVQVTELPLSSAGDDSTPAALRNLLEQLQPAGAIDFAATFERTERGNWLVHDLAASSKNLSVRPAPFSYPIGEIAGTFLQVGSDEYIVEATGKAGLRPVRLNARVQRSAAGTDVAVTIRAEAIPLDETFREACRTDTRELLRQLGLEGTADVVVQLSRPAVPGAKLGWAFQAHLHDGELDYERFPYRLVNLAGDVSYDSASGTLQFWNATARNGNAAVQGRGTFRRVPEVNINGTSPIGDVPPGLTLDLVADRVSLNEELRQALPPSTRQIWEELNLEGSVDLVADINWTPGHEADVEITKFDVTDGVLNPRAFPYVLHTVSARATYAPSRLQVTGGAVTRTPARVVIREFVGWHDGGVRVEADDATLLLPPGGNWSLSLPRLSVEELSAGPELRRACPPTLRQVIETLDPAGRFNLAGRLNLRGTADPRRPAAAAWDVVARFSDASLTPGLEITGIGGDVRCVGESEADRLEVTGDVTLSEASVLGQRLANVRGPFRYADGQVQVGSRDVLANVREASREPNVPVEQRFRADYLGGLLTFDALVSIEGPLHYIGRATLHGGSLERYARNGTAAGGRDLAGVMTGWLNFWGEGRTPADLRGRGALEISPAALYELPVIMQMFKALFPTPPDNTAFRAAWLNFSIRDSAIIFEPMPGDASAPIVLTGDVLRLDGAGYVGFDKRLRITLDTKLPANPVRGVSAVPLVGPVVSQVVGGVVAVATTGWVSVVVEGTTDHPTARQVPLKNLEEGWRRMFDSLAPPAPRSARLPPGAR